MMAVVALCKLGTEIRQLKGRHPVLSHGHWNYRGPRSHQLSKPSKVEALDSKLSTFSELYLRWISIKDWLKHERNHDYNIFNCKTVSFEERSFNFSKNFIVLNCKIQNVKRYLFNYYNNYRNKAEKINCKLHSITRYY